MILITTIMMVIIVLASGGRTTGFIPERGGDEHDHCQVHILRIHRTKNPEPIILENPISFGEIHPLEK